MPRRKRSRKSSPRKAASPKKRSPIKKLILRRTSQTPERSIYEIVRNPPQSTFLEESFDETTPSPPPFIDPAMPKLSPYFAPTHKTDNRVAFLEESLEESSPSPPPLPEIDQENVEPSSKVLSIKKLLSPIIQKSQTSVPSKMTNISSTSTGTAIPSTDQENLAMIPSTSIYHPIVTVIPSSSNPIVAAVPAMPKLSPFNFTPEQLERFKSQRPPAHQPLSQCVTAIKLVPQNRSSAPVFLQMSNTDFCRILPRLPQRQIEKV